MTFHRTGEGGLWRATRPDGRTWSEPEILTGVRCADPGANEGKSICANRGIDG